MIKIQDIIYDDVLAYDVNRHLYVRSNELPTTLEDGSKLLYKKEEYSFFTYFNSFSIGKWKKYTEASNYYLVLDMQGSFELDLVGGKDENSKLEKLWFKRYKLNFKERKEIVLEIPDSNDYQLFSFSVKPKNDTTLYNAYYACDIDEDKIRQPYIAMVTTTFKKEEYVKRNVKLLEKYLFDDPEYKDAFCWNIIDNGRTLGKTISDYEEIKLFPNKNVGGAGGFSRGMIESLKQNRKPSHILLMDDDVVFSPESFKRLHKLLSLVKEEYKDYFVSGAMLKMAFPNIQHEDIGKLNNEGYHEAVKPNFDLNLIENIVRNESFVTDDENMYSAWWFCCIPTTIASLDNLPVPVFVRGDDVEYSLRNKAKFITMNGICIWHEGFEGKFSASLEYYQVCRNELAVTASNPALEDVDCIGHIKMLFWEEMYKFNYKGASLLLDAVEDFLKGPDFFKAIDGEQSMKDKKKLDNELSPITPEINAKIDYDKLYEYEALNGKIKTLLYNYTYNCQARVPNLFANNRPGVIPYGWGYWPGKQCLHNEIIAVDTHAEKYVMYKKDRRKFVELKKRFENVIGEYDRREDELKKLYRESMSEIKNEKFWNEYLGI